jgi:FtsH-binding integral membrane protein
MLAILLIYITPSSRYYAKPYGQKPLPQTQLLFIAGMVLFIAFSLQGGVQSSGAFKSFPYLILGVISFATCLWIVQAPNTDCEQTNTSTTIGTLWHGLTFQLIHFLP